MLTLFLIIILAVVIGAWLGRMDGGGWPNTPELLERLCIMSFFALACFPFAWGWSVLAYLGGVGLATGHGQYYLNRVVKLDMRDEYFDFLVRPFFGHDPRLLPASSVTTLTQYVESYGHTKLYWRCVFGMFVTGSLVGLPAALIAIKFGRFDEAVLLSLTGVAKALAYIIGYEFWGSTAPAECINGGLRTLLAMTALFITLSNG